ncbi:formyltransferase family protein [Pseudoalteromonas sp. 20-MNA-CIBAN-0454]|uniref:formyltransferase family protein n=1 Tax=Pseudoalteromonas sp. 20-MNA-CIBAN-0454 TaxID=3140424 RepID=UPI003328D93E
MKTVDLYLLGEKGLCVLASILSNQVRCNITVVIGTDKGIKNDYSSEIEALCLEKGVNYFFRGIESLHGEYSIAVGWRWLINRQNLIVLHDSILPKYRGFSPLVNMLINGEKNIGVTALHASEKYDEGDIIGVAVRSVNYPIKIRDAIKLISGAYVEVVLNILNKINTELPLTRICQEHSAATYSLWRDADDYFIDWNLNASIIKRFIDAVGYPYDGAKAKVKGEIVEVIEAEEVNDVFVESRSSHIGKVIFKENGFPVVICKSGLLKIKILRNELSEDIIPILGFRVRFE